MKVTHPKEMKAFGRAVESFDNEVWEQTNLLKESEGKFNHPLS